MNQLSLCLANSWQKTISLTALRWARLKEVFGFYRNYGGASVALYSDEGLMLQTSALQLFYRGNLTLSTHVMILCSVQLLMLLI